MIGRPTSLRPAVLATLLVLGAGFSTRATASPISGPSQITPSTALASSGAGFTIDEIADGITSDAPPFNGFAAVPGQVGTIRLDLNIPYDLSSFVLWNDINVLGEGVKTFRLDFFDAANVPLGSTPVLTAAAGTVAAQTFAFGSPVLGAKRVDLVVLTLNPSPCCGLRLEIREVAFNGDLPTPAEAGTWGRLKGAYR